MSLLTIGEAAARLHTTPSTIRSWEQRLGYPMPARSGSGRRLYDESVIALLGDALARGLTISSAVRRIREETGSHTELLAIELAAIRFGACDRLLEAAITLRGVCRAFDEVVMDAVDQVVEDAENAGVAALAVGWASDRALAYRSLATTSIRSSVVVVDNSVENDTLRAAGDNLRLQLRHLGVATYALRGSAVLDLRMTAQLIGTGAGLFVGPLPAAFGRTPATGLSVVAAFRCGRASASGVIPQLSPRPRVAADEFLSLLMRGSGSQSWPPRVEQVNGLGASRPT